ncbi:hypothetical protein GP486_003608 [Trichoglossum hirsutum]|uniref:Uncharacterized protein n=1 Tax=Trichoglossum hirsutum TaxID=265104 RepID=A0A9P8LCR5_9PEZI|nr:hypothetical protein GP486_003608 [Trichoglossum hirsutum]
MLRSAQNQHSQYKPISGNFVTKLAYESYATPLAFGEKLMVVPEPPAVVPGQVNAESIAIISDHIGMVKFGSETDDGFRKVAGHLQLMVGDAPAEVLEKWVAKNIMESDIGRTMKPDLGVTFDLKDVPTTSAFFGRESDLNVMEKYLNPYSGLE